MTEEALESKLARSESNAQMWFDIAEARGQALRKIEAWCEVQIAHPGLLPDVKVLLRMLQGQDMKREHELTEAERERAWMVVYDALHYGSPAARPILMDQKVLIEIVADLQRKFAR